MGSVNKSIERSFCVNLDPCEFNNDNDVVTKMLDTYGYMSTGSQPETGVSVTNQNTVAREGHRATQVALTPSQTESQLYSFGSPMGATEHGGRSRVGLSQNALCALSLHQRATGSRPVNLYGEQMETTGSFHNGGDRHFGRTPDCFSGWNSTPNSLIRARVSTSLCSCVET